MLNKDSLRAGFSTSAASITRLRTIATGTVEMSPFLMSQARRVVVPIFLTTSMIFATPKQMPCFHDDDNTTKPMAQRLR
jgi:hypothetical protein